MREAVVRRQSQAFNEPVSGDSIVEASTEIITNSVGKFPPTHHTWMYYTNSLEA